MAISQTRISFLVTLASITLMSATTTFGAEGDTVQMNANGTPSFLDIRGFPITEQSVSWESRSLLVIDAYSDQFGISVPLEELDVLRVDTDFVGNTHVHFRQKYRGIPVEGSRLSVHFDRLGNPKTITGLVQPNISAPTIPTIKLEEAANAAIQTVRDAISLDRRVVRDEPIALRVLTTDLVIFPNQTAEQDKNLLAYKVTVVGDGVREFVFIDASDGSLLEMFTGIHDNRKRETYKMRWWWPWSYSLATLKREEDDPAISDVDVDNAHDYAGDTYDFFYNAYGRDSIDNGGMTLKSYVDYGWSYGNAFWDGEKMTYGDGYPVDDVAAHEMTHGVTEHTANLVYADESGALNESFSDIFGETVDLINEAGTDTPAVRWLMGEDLPIGEIRSMSNPPEFDDPDRVGSDLYYCGTDDHGGVHTNSGVPNKLFYLLSDGGTFNGQSISALGLTKSSAIHYQDLTQYLGPNSTLLDHYNGLMASCSDLVGANLNDPLTGEPSEQEITVNDCNQVRNAGLAVELNNPVCPDFLVDGEIGCPNADPALFFDGMPINLKNAGTFSGQWSGNDYNGTPLWFRIEGTYKLSSDVTADVHIYSDANYSSHVRTDRCEAKLVDGQFRDDECELIEDTSAGCRPIWMLMTESGNTSAIITSDMRYEKDTGCLLRAVDP